MFRKLIIEDGELLVPSNSKRLNFLRCAKYLLAELTSFAVLVV